MNRLIRSICAFTIGSGGATLPVVKIGGDAQMREQSRILEYVADAPPFRGHIDVPPGVEQRRIVKGYLA